MHRSGAIRIKGSTRASELCRVKRVYIMSRSCQVHLIKIIFILNIIK